MLAIILRFCIFVMLYYKKLVTQLKIMLNKINIQSTLKVLPNFIDKLYCVTLIPFILLYIIV